MYTTFGVWYLKYTEEYTHNYISVFEGPVVCMYTVTSPPQKLSETLAPSVQYSLRQYLVSINTISCSLIHELCLYYPCFLENMSINYTTFTNSITIYLQNP